MEMIKTKKIFLVIMIAVFAFSFTIGLTAVKAFAETTASKEYVLVGNEIPTGSNKYGKRSDVSYELGKKAFEFPVNREFQVQPNAPIDLSSYDFSKLAISMWVYSAKLPASFSGDNQIEVSSQKSGFDENEYAWWGSDVFYNKDYVPGKWNKVILRFKAGQAPGVNMKEIQHFRFYYLCDMSGVYVSDISFIETDLVEGIAEVREVLKPTLNEVIGLPSSAVEGETLTLPQATAVDANGNAIASTAISVAVTGPNGYKSYGYKPDFTGGPGEYSVTYSARDGLGVADSKSYSITATQAGEDKRAPFISWENCPAEFLLEKERNFAEYITVSDNRGLSNVTVNAKLFDSSGTAIKSFNGNGSRINLTCKPNVKGNYRFEVKATDEAGNVTESSHTFASYSNPDSEKSIQMFDFSDKNISFVTGPKYSGRVVNTHPSKSKGQSLEFIYNGGATDLIDNSTYYQCVMMVNNNLPSLKDIDMKWAAIRMWVYIDKVYDNDAQWMPSNGGGYGNMGLGIGSRARIYGSPRMEYDFKAIGTQTGWTEVTIKLGREFDSNDVNKIDYLSLSTMYLHANFGSARRILLNNIRLVESDDYTRGLWYDNLGRKDYVRILDSEIPTASTAEVNNDVEYPFPERAYQNSVCILPNLVATDYVNCKNVIDNVKVKVTDKSGNIYNSQVFTPMETGNHTVVYTAYDIYGQVVTLTKDLTVDPPNVMPEITVTGEFATNVEKGSKISLPNITATDEEGENVTLKLYLISPNGDIEEITSRYVVPKMTGVNIIKAVAVDAAGQKVIEEFEFMVKSTFRSNFFSYNPLLNLAWIIPIAAVGLGGIAVGTVFLIKCLNKNKKIRRKENGETNDKN